MWDWHSVVPMSQLYRTPLAPLVIGGTLDLLGGWGLEVVMALLFAASVVAWTRTAFIFGPRAALLTAVALLAYPGYGILFHTPASEPVAAAACGMVAESRERGSSRAPDDLPSSAQRLRRRHSPARHSRYSCSSRRCPSSFACPGAHGSDPPPLAPESRSWSWARGRSQTDSVTTTTPWARDRGFSRSIGRSRPTTSSVRAMGPPRGSSRTR